MRSTTCTYIHRAQKYLLVSRYLLYRTGRGAEGQIENDRRQKSANLLSDDDCYERNIIIISLDCPLLYFFLLGLRLEALIKRRQTQLKLRIQFLPTIFRMKHRHMYDVLNQDRISPDPA